MRFPLNTDPTLNKGWCARALILAHEVVGFALGGWSNLGRSLEIFSGYLHYTDKTKRGIKGFVHKSYTLDQGQGYRLFPVLKLPDDGKSKRDTFLEKNP